MTKNKLAIVTLTRNNFDELSETVVSIVSQTERPDRIIVLDSSSEETRGRVKLLCNKLGCDYQFTPPMGIYPAMRHSLGLLAGVEYVWWLNSSDVLHGRSSVEEVLRLVRQSNHQWLVGNLLRTRGEEVSIADWLSPPQVWVKALQTGRIGFPHPSTIFRVDVLKEIDAYPLGYRAASDYATALQYANRAGPPTLLDSTIAEHRLGGFTSRNKLRYFIEKSKARKQFSPSFSFTREILVLFETGIRALFRIVLSKP